VLGGFELLAILTALAGQGPTPAPSNQALPGLTSFVPMVVVMKSGKAEEVSQLKQVGNTFVFKSVPDGRSYSVSSTVIDLQRTTAVNQTLRDFSEQCQKGSFRLGDREQVLGVDPLVDSLLSKHFPTCWMAVRAVAQGKTTLQASSASGVPRIVVDARPGDIRVVKDEAGGITKLRTTVILPNWFSKDFVNPTARSLAEEIQRTTDAKKIVMELVRKTEDAGGRGTNTIGTCSFEPPSGSANRSTEDLSNWELTCTFGTEEAHPEGSAPRRLATKPEGPPGAAGLTATVTVTPTQTPPPSGSEERLRVRSEAGRLVVSNSGIPTPTVTALSRMRIQRDEVEGISWFFDKDAPSWGTYVKLYFGQFDDKRLGPLRIKLQYHGYDWLFVRAVTLKTTGIKFEFEVSDVRRDIRGGDISEGNVEESVDEVVEPMLWLALKEMLAGGRTIVRFQGRQSSADHVVTDRERSSMQAVVDAFRSLGGKPGS